MNPIDPILNAAAAATRAEALLQLAALAGALAAAAADEAEVADALAAIFGEPA